MSNIVGNNPLASRFYSFIINKTIEGIRFYSEGGVRLFGDIEYMFVDANSICVAVMKDGSDLRLCNKPNNNGYMKIMVKKSISDLRVSTEGMKGFLSRHYNEFPYIIRFSRIIDSYFTRSEINWNISLVASCLKVNNWVQNNIIDILNDLNKLISRSHFYLI